MTTTEQIDELMLRWEESGRAASPAELCADSPQLVDALRRRIRTVLDMEELFGITDTDSQRTMKGPSGDDDTATEAEPLPTIPGYEITRVIDQGGMGVIYEARQIKAGRTVAIKMMSGLHLRTKHKERFCLEAKAVGSLHHPNFVQVFEVNEVNGRPFFSMEYVAGGSLAKKIAREPLTPHAAAALVETLARAMQAAHEHGVVHRDLKPSNIMLAANGAPKIADFGLAKRLDDDSGQTHTGEILGTPSYMAPEQAEGKKDDIGPHTDVYALGAILYELLAGKPPFVGISPLDSLRMVTSQDPVPPSRQVPSVPRDLEAICLKCLEKTPHHRYGSALLLAEDLHRFLTGRPVQARRIGPIQRGYKWGRRHPQTVALGVALLLLATLVPLYFVFANYQTQRELRLKAEKQAPLVREILQRNCYECHGENPKKIERSLNILDHQQLVDSVRRVVVPGSPALSRLIQRIEDGSMPPEEQEVRLPRVSEQEMVILRDWIRGGAPPLPEPDPERPTPPVVPFSELAAQTKDILNERCYHCHNYKKQDAGLKILNHRWLVSLHHVVVPGDPEASKLYKVLVLPEDDEHRMPKGEDGLPKEEIDTIHRWILEGAPPFPKARK